MKNKFIVILLVAVSIVACQDKKEKELEEEMAEEATEVKEEIMETEEEGEWEVLFDGNNLDLWRGYNSDEMYSNWTIEDNALKFTPGDEGGKNIITKETYENFVLTVDWKVSEGANSGIFYGVFEDEKFNEAYQTGPEIQVLDNERHPDAKVANGTHTAGSLYDLIGCQPELINPAGEWNTCVLEIDHNSNKGTITMNGTEALSFPVHGEEWEAMIEKSKFKGWEGFGSYRDGHIGLQDHGDVVWFKDIKIKRI